MLGELPSVEPLWKRALRLRQAEQWAEKFFARAAAEAAPEQLSLLDRVEVAEAPPTPPAPEAPPAPREPRAPAGPRPGCLF